ncbi:MAG: hypothetical protein LH702_01200 [Phormidesmis sp. CAN_BIN44]|nr:hypothetical protein [Phormidesmis sp. CAN_BIN44]
MQTRQTQILPNELLIRWNDEGVLQGAHVVFLGKVLDDQGNVLAAQPMPPQAIALGEGEGFPLAEILNQALIDALKKIEVLERQRETLTQTLATQAANHQQQIDLMQSNG